MDSISEKNETRNLWVIASLSVAIPVVVAVLLFMPTRIDGGEWVYILPHLNAAINTATSILLIAGAILIKNKKPSLHKAAMTSAFILGAIFLVSYVIYHATVPSTSFGGEGTIKTVYYFFLISHILLAIVVVPFVLLAFYYAWTQKFERHKKIVKVTFPVWLYVSVTGVIVYFMIAPYYSF